MQFIKAFVRNLLILLALGAILLFMFPDIMKPVLQFYSALLGPLALVVLVVIALPRNTR